MSIVINERPADNKSAVIEVKGFIDTSTSAELEGAIKKHIESGTCRLVIDLQGSEFVSSAGWGVMVASLRKVRGAGGDIKLAAMIDKVEKVFKLMEFDSLIDCYKTVNDAVKSF